MMMQAITTAAIMICSSCAMPIAVMIESSENTRSMMMIWTITQKNAPAFGAALAPPRRRASTSVWISWVALAIRNNPPPIRMMSRQEKPMPATENTSSRQPDQPHQQAQQQDAEHQRQRQPDLPRALGLRLAESATRSRTGRSRCRCRARSRARSASAMPPRLPGWSSNPIMPEATSTAGSPRRLPTI